MNKAVQAVVVFVRRRGRKKIRATARQEISFNIAVRSMCRLDFVFLFQEGAGKYFGNLPSRECVCT